MSNSPFDDPATADLETQGRAARVARVELFASILQGARIVHVDLIALDRLAGARHFRGEVLNLKTFWDRGARIGQEGQDREGRHEGL